MANAFTTQKLVDTNQRALIKFTGKFDGSGDEAATQKVVAANLNFALDTNNAIKATSGGAAKNLYTLMVKTIKYAVNSANGSLEILWNGANANTTMVTLKGSGVIGGTLEPLLIKNNATDANGDISFATHGFANNDSYTIDLELRKGADTYDAGQTADPDAFNR